MALLLDQQPASGHDFWSRRLLRARFAHFAWGEKRQEMKPGWKVKFSVKSLPLPRRVRADTFDQIRDSSIVRVGQLFSRARCLHIDDRQVEPREKLEEIAICRLSPGEIERNSKDRKS